MDENENQHPEHHVELPIDVSISKTQSNCIQIQSLSSILTQFHAGYFRISLSLTSQAFLLKILIEPIQDAHALRRLFSSMPSSVHTLIWFLALFILATLSFLYILKCVLHFDMVKDEFLNHVGVNYLFVPWICWLILLESSPFLSPRTLFFKILWWVFVVPMVMLDVKIYGQWFTKGKRFLSVGANPTSQLSVIGNLVGAQAAAQMGWKESALCMFSLAPSMASLAWNSICGKFDTTCKMLFFLSFFLFLSLVSRPMLFKKSMKKFNVTWWAYSFPLTALALASVEYAHEVKGIMAHTIMFLLSSVSVLVSLILLLITVIKMSRHAFTCFQP
ncbi:S-type anion channel SLAH1 isoform X4 [Vigna angularis]|uniref:S-type anion channel SLAH1 isoform X4 n=1 Tax=Phaseolus angularis TaxID=3914 RepID=UPI0022B42EF2|nr:S-type anion channel SLAH1 isoform X4 [Vigna angularis]